MNAWVVRADARQLPLLAESVDCIVTSPPYWGLRDYGCAGQIGLEPTPAEYVEQIVEAMEDARRALKPKGTAWVNLGDSYAQAGGPGWQGKNGQRADRRFTAVRDTVPMREICRRPPPALKPKDLVGIPWRVAFALQAAGWWLRSDIVWAKPNPMPESVTDRPTRSHEYVFLLSKSERYWYDAEAIKDPGSENLPWSARSNGGAKQAALGHNAGGRLGLPAKKQDALGKNTYTGFNDRWREHPVALRNARSVWTITTQPYTGAHFATFPEELARRCILAGGPMGGTVLDPFAGSGTVGKVAIENGRNAILCDLAYQPLAVRRISGVQRPLMVTA